MIKEKLNFTDYEIYSDDLLRKTRRVDFALSYWTRVVIDIPDSFHIKAIEDWIQDNLSGRWYYYMYSKKLFDKSDNYSHRVVFRFETSTDALLFKLSGGHQCYME